MPPILKHLRRVTYRHQTATSDRTSSALLKAIRGAHRLHKPAVIGMSPPSSPHKTGTSSTPVEKLTLISNHLTGQPKSFKPDSRASPLLSLERTYSTMSSQPAHPTLL